MSERNGVSAHERRAAEIKKAEQSLYEVDALQEQLEALANLAASGGVASSILWDIAETLSKSLRKPLNTIEHALMDLEKIKG